MTGPTAAPPTTAGPVFVTGTGTGIGKTVTTAALTSLALAAGRRVAVVKLAQTGVAAGAPGDLADVRRLTGPNTRLRTEELARYPDPLSPEAAARRAGRAPLELDAAAAAVTSLAATHDVVLAEGAGGLLVRFHPDGWTLADLAGRVAAPVVLVVRAGLGTLNETALAVEALARRRVVLSGAVIGSWPARPGLAEVENLTDLETVTGQPLGGALPEGVGRLAATAFRKEVAPGLHPRFGGTFEPAALRAAAG
jgi:dethiobiotin synthase